MTKTNKKGFTIIEVVLVLAIAGLIFLMVFIALPALQRSQRNTRRRQDMARILSAFNDYSSNNNGKMPQKADITNFMDRYVGDSESDQRKDPDGQKYTLVWVGSPKNPGKLYSKNTSDETKHGAFNHNIYYFVKAACDDSKGAVEGAVKSADGDREIAIFYRLEGGAIYCGDNS